MKNKLPLAIGFAIFGLATSAYVYISYATSDKKAYALMSNAYDATYASRGRIIKLYNFRNSGFDLLSILGTKNGKQDRSVIAYRVNTGFLQMDVGIFNDLDTYDLDCADLRYIYTRPGRISGKVKSTLVERSNKSLAICNLTQP